MSPGSCSEHLRPAARRYPDTGECGEPAAHTTTYGRPTTGSACTATTEILQLLLLLLLLLLLQDYSVQCPCTVPRYLLYSRYWDEDSRQATIDSSLPRTDILLFYLSLAEAVSCTVPRYLLYTL